MRETGDPRSLYQAGRTSVFSGEKLERGLQALRSYIEAEPDTERMPSVAHARWRLGMVYQRMDLARRQYQTALALDPELEEAREALESL